MRLVVELSDRMKVEKFISWVEIEGFKEHIKHNTHAVPNSGRITLLVTLNNANAEFIERLKKIAKGVNGTILHEGEMKDED